MNTQQLNEYLYLKILITSFILIFIVSCSEKQQVSHEELLSLYQITDRECNVPESYKADCEQARFVELVKGRFYGVSNDEVAFVIWSGDAGGELLYQARKIDLDEFKVPAEGELIIVSDKSEKEYLTILDRKIVSYDLTVTAANNTRRVYRYTLQSVSRDSVTEYQMEYPENE